MLILALDTSSSVGAALLDDERLLAAEQHHDPRRHGELLAPAVRSVLAAAGVDRRELDAVAVGVGPAPFTGLRVGVATALVLGEALGIPVHGVGSPSVFCFLGGGSRFSWSKFHRPPTGSAPSMRTPCARRARR